MGLPLLLEKDMGWAVVVYAFSSRTGEAEANGTLRVQGQPGQRMSSRPHRETYLYQTFKKKKKPLKIQQITSELYYSVK